MVFRHEDQIPLHARRMNTQTFGNTSKYIRYSSLSRNTYILPVGSQNSNENDGKLVFYYYWWLIVHTILHLYLLQELWNLISLSPFSSLVLPLSFLSPPCFLFSFLVKSTFSLLLRTVVGSMSINADHLGHRHLGILHVWMSSDRVCWISMGIQNNVSITWRWCKASSPAFRSECAVRSSAS